MNKILKIVIIIGYICSIFFCMKFIIEILPTISEFDHEAIRFFIIILLFASIQESKIIRARSVITGKNLALLAVLHTAIGVFAVILYSTWQENALIDSLLRFFVMNQRVNILILSSAVIINLVLSALFIHYLKKKTRKHDYVSRIVSAA